VRRLGRRQDNISLRFDKVDLVPVLPICLLIGFGCNLLGNPPHFLPQSTFSSSIALKINKPPAQNGDA